jgi:hypothetical protein
VHDLAQVVRTSKVEEEVGAYKSVGGGGTLWHHFDHTCSSRVWKENGSDRREEGKENQMERKGEKKMNNKQTNLALRRLHRITLPGKTSED